MELRRSASPFKIALHHPSRLEQGGFHMRIAGFSAAAVLSALLAFMLFFVVLPTKKAWAPLGGATRTWVSGVGDDANPCSRTAPCKTFAGAISKTGIGGEIDCVDSGGFGAVTITKAITLDCTGTF